MNSPRYIRDVALIDDETKWRLWIKSSGCHFYGNKTWK